ncbi:MAG: winged helix-turn-helix domain-containing protein [Pyrinomonadaceae bacterium]
MNSRTLFHEDAPVPLKPKVVETLIVLIEDAGNVVSKDFLMEKVWGETFVEESNLSVNIYELRKAFKKFGDTENLIQTIPRRGFRFNAEVLQREISQANEKKIYSVSEQINTEGSIKDLPENQQSEKRNESQIKFGKANRYAVFAVGVLLLFIAAGLTYRQHNAAVAQNLQSRQNSSKQSNFEKRPTENLEAYQFYRRGIELWQTRNAEKMRQAAELFRRSIALDANFALSYVGLADTYSMLNNDPAEWQMAEEYVQKALTIEPNSADAHASLAFIEAMDKWQWDEAENEYKHAIELDPNCGKAHQWYATLLMIERRFDEAEVELRKAVEIEPMSPNYNSDLCEFDTYAKPFEETKAQCLRSEEIAPLANNAMILLQAFIVESVRADKIDHSQAQEILPKQLYFIYQTDGGRGVTKEMLRETLEKPRDPTFDDYNLSVIYALLGEKEKSFECLERTFKAHAFLLPFINARREFDSMRDDERFKNLTRRIGLNS